MMASLDRVSVVGLGRMGLGLAISLRRIGREVVGFDLSADARKAAAEEGIPLVDGLTKLAGSKIVLLSLPDGPDVTKVVEQLLPVLPKASLIIDCSTIDPDVTTALAGRAAEAGVRFRDAGMAGGGPADAAAGKLLFLVGCPHEDWEDIQSILGPIGRRVVRCGDTGAGVTLKVVNNLLALTVFLADVEALSIAAAAGLDQKITMDVLRQTAAANTALDALVDRQLLARKFEGAFRTSLAHKDARIAVALAGRLGIDANTLSPTLAAYGEAVETGLGEMAAGAAGLVVERHAGVQLGPDRA